MKTRNLLTILAAAVALVCASTANAATRYSVASGNWSDTNTWSETSGGTVGASVPVTGDAVTIERGYTVTVDVTDAACTSVQLGSSAAGNTGTLTFSGVNPALTVSGAVSLGAGGAAARTGTIAFTSGSTLTAGSLALGSTGTTKAPGIITMTAGGTLSVAGTITVNTVTGNTWTPGAGTVEKTGTSTLPATIFTTFNNLTINSGTTTMGRDLTISGNLDVQAGGFTVGAFTIIVTGTTTVSGTLSITSATGTKTFSGDVSINSGGILSESAAELITYGGNVTINNGGTLTEYGAATMACAGDFKNDGTYTASTGVHTFSGTDKTFSGANAIVIPSLTITGTYQHNGTLTVNTAFAGTGTLTQGTGATLNIGGPTTTAITIATLNASANVNTVNYTGAAQTVKGTAYHHLTLGGSGAKTLTGLSAINGSFTLSGTATATAAANLSIGGDLTVSGGTLDLSTFTADRATSGATLTVADGATLKIGGTGTVPANYAAHVIGATSTVEYSGTAQTVSVENYGNLTLSGSGIKTMTGVTTIGGNLTISGTATMTDNAAFTVGGAFNYASTSGTTTLTAATPTSIGTFNQSGAGILVDSGNTITVTGTGANTWVKSAGTFTATGTVIFTGAAPQIGAANFHDLTFSGTVAALTTGAITVAGDLVVPLNTTLTVGTVTIAVTGSTTVNGTLTHSGTGTNTYTGDVTINNGGVFNETAAAALAFGGNVTINNGGTLAEFGAATVSCAGSFQNDGTYTASTGTHTFSGATRTLSGANAIVIPTLTVTGTYANNGTLTVATLLTVTSPGVLTNNGTITATTALAGNGGLIQGTGATLNLGGATTSAASITTLDATASPNTVNYNRSSAQTVKATTYHHLTLSGSGAKTLTSLSTVNGNLTLSGTAAATTAANLAIGGNLTIGDGTTFTAAGVNLTVTGTTTVGAGTSGNLTISATAGTKIFTGLVTINAGATWNNSINSTVTFRGGITSTPSFTGGSGVHTFDVNSQTLTGTFSIPNVTVIGVTLNNSGTLTVGTALSGTGGLTQGAGATLNLGSTAAISTLTATASPNTVNYTGAAQTVNATTYHHLTLSGSGTKSAAADLGVNGDFTVGTAVTFSPAATVVINGPGAAGNILGSGTIQVTLTPGGLVDQYKFSTYTLTGLTVSYAGAGAQTVNNTSTVGFVGNYGALTTAGSGTKTLDGAIAVNGAVTIGTGTTLDADSTGNYGITVGGNWVGTGAFTPQTGTVTLNGTAQTISGTTTFYNLTLAGSGIKTITTITTIGGNLTLSGTATATTAANLAIAGNLGIGTGTGLTTGATFTLGVAGTTSVSGTLTLATAYAKTFTGDVTINTGGVWNETGAAPISFGGNLQNDGTLTASTGTHTFTGAAKTFSGANAITIPSVTVSGTYQNDGTLTISTTLAGAGTLTQGTGATLNIGAIGTSLTLTTLTATASPNTVNYNSGSDQTVKATAYHHLTLSGLTTTKTMAGVTTINGDLTLSDSATASLGAALTVGGDVTIGATAILAASANNLGVAGNWINNRGVAGFTYSGTQTITFDGTGAQSIGGSATTTFNNLTVNKASGTATADTSFTVALVFTIAAGSTFDAADKTITLSGTGTPLVVGGTLTPSTSTVSYTSTAGANVTGGINYYNLTVNSSGDMFTALADMTVQNVLTVTAGTFNVNGKTITLSGGSTPLVAAGTLSGGALASSTIAYTSASGATVAGLLYTNLTVNGTGTFALGGAATVNGTLALTSGALSIGANTLTLNAGIATTGGSLTGGPTSSINLATATGGAVTLPAVADGLLNLTVNRTEGITLGGAVTVGDTLTLTAGTITDAANLTLGDGALVSRATGSLDGALGGFGSSVNVTYTGGTAVTTGPEIQTSAGVLNNLTNNNTAGVTLGSSVTVNGTLDMTTGPGILDTSAANSYSLTVFGNLAVATGTLTANGSTITVGGNFTGSGVFTPGTSTLILNGTGSQTIAFSTGTGNLGGYYNLTINKISGTVSLTGATTVNNDLTITAGVLDVTASNYALTVGANWSNSGTFTQRSGTVTFNGTSAQSLAGATTFNSLTVNNSAGLTLSADQTVNGTLTLTAGNITTGANSIIVGSSGSRARTSGWIFGNEQKVFTADTVAGFTFDIGDSAAYEPLTVTNLNLTGSATLKAFTTAGSHPQLGTAGINSSGDVAQYWTLQLVSGTVVSYGGRFNYPSGESSGAPSAYLVKVWDGSAWSSATVNGTPLSTATAFKSQSGFGDFAIGNAGPVANADSFSREKNLSLKMLKSALLANDTGTATLTVTGVTSPSAEGATVTASGLYVYYTPANNNNDTFTYTVTDGNNATATGTVTVNVNGTPSVGVLEIEHVGGGSVALSFYGIPDYKYYIQRSCGDNSSFTDLVGPITTPADGHIQYTDDASGCNPAFYRTRSE